jgi:hypothetical protein
VDAREISSQRLITPDMLQHLPEPARRYMAYTGVVGKPWITTVRLKQVGRFRRGLDQPWMSTSAEQIFSINPPAFVWRASFKVAGLPLMHAQDMYTAGRGHMFGKLAGLFTLFDQRGVEIDQGTMTRYLGEAVWFPTAFLGANVIWRGVDDHTADVTFIDCDKSVTARLVIDDAGRLTLFSARRYRENKGAYSLACWSVPMTDYAMHSGLNIPVRGRVTWNLPSGDLPYYDWEITEVEYNRSIQAFRG